MSRSGIVILAAGLICLAGVVHGEERKNPDLPYGGFALDVYYSGSPNVRPGNNSVWIPEERGDKYVNSQYIASTGLDFMFAPHSKITAIISYRYDYRVSEVWNNGSEQVSPHKSYIGARVRFYFGGH